MTTEQKKQFAARRRANVRAVLRVIRAAGDAGISRPEIEGASGVSPAATRIAMSTLTDPEKRRIRICGYAPGASRRVPLYGVGCEPDAKLEPLPIDWSKYKAGDPENPEGNLTSEVRKKHQKWQASWTPRRCFVFEPECVIGERV